jgi:hypothetical protein
MNTPSRFKASISSTIILIKIKFTSKLHLQGQLIAEYFYIV